MASSNTALSKAALNTLRGVLVTTSCSVALLAEERRRRIKVLSAAVDNARKIHAAKAARGIVSPLAIDPSDLEAALAGIDSEYVAKPSAHGKRYRQKKQDDTKPITGPKTHTSEETAPARHATNKPAQFDYIAEVMAAARRSNVPQAKKRFTASGKPNAEPVAFDAVAEVMSAGRRSNEAPVATRATPSRKRYTAAAPVDGLVETVDNNLSTTESSKHTADGLSLSTEVDNAVTNERLEFNHVRVPPKCREQITTELADATAALIEIARILFQNFVESATKCKTFDSAVEILKVITCIPPYYESPASLREIIAEVVVDLVKCSVDLNTDRRMAVLEALLPLQHSTEIILAESLAWVGKHRPSQAADFARFILAFFTDPKREEMWNGGDMIVRLIKNQSARSADVAIASYEMLKSAGLHTNVQAGKQQYLIRREAIVAACKYGGETNLINDEMAALRQLNEEEVEKDATLQVALTSQQLPLGACDAVFDSLKSLGKRTKLKPTEFRESLSYLTSIFAKMHDAEELASWLRYVVETYGMAVENVWAFSVLDEYAFHRDIEGMMVWLEFCLGHGLKVDVDFLTGWKNTCRKHLHFDEGNTRYLGKRLNQIMTLPPRTGEDTQPSRLEGDLRERMVELTESGSWHKACLVYEAASSRSRDTCQDSLGLAMEAHTQTTGGSAESALLLLERARRSGRDTAKAQTRFLCKEIERRPSGEISALLAQAARCGTQISLVVYKRAVEKVLGEDVEAAHSILQGGVEHLGNGKLAYDGYSFTKLLYTKIALYRYDEAEALLSEFVATKPRWHGTRICNTSIKFAIREVTKRAAMRTKASDAHVDAVESRKRRSELRLADELQHALDSNGESSVSLGHHETIADMIVQAAEDAVGGPKGKHPARLKPQTKRRGNGRRATYAVQRTSSSHGKHSQQFGQALDQMQT